MKERTGNNVHDAFVGEAKAYQRLLMYARKAPISRPSLKYSITCCFVLFWVIA